MAELCIELEGWVTVKEIHDKFSPISCLCFFHRKQWHFTKLFIFETACSDKIWIWTLSYSGLLLCVLFETSYSELSGLGYKLWNLFCPLNEWPEKQSLKLGFLLGFSSTGFSFYCLLLLLFSENSLECFSKLQALLWIKPYHVLTSQAESFYIANITTILNFFLSYVSSMPTA